MTDITNATVSTKTDARKETVPVETNLTLNWEGMTLEDTRALAQQALIVKLQGKWRTAGIPTEITVNVVDHKVGTRSAPVKLSVEEQAKRMSPEDRAALIAKLAAM